MQELLDNKALINDMLARYGVRFGIAEYKEKQIRVGSSKRQRKKNLYRYGNTWR